MQIKHISESQSIDNNNRLISLLEILSDFERGESVKNWLDLIYGSSIESSIKIQALAVVIKIAYHQLEIENSGSMHIEVNIVEIGVEVINVSTKYAVELDDTNTVKTSTVEKMRAAIYLSLDELWGIPDETGLKASMLDL
ncbi:hypothetical protein C2G38_2200481 [Gigaspora rosea]|uniref:Uncharacterized protein n=1 Tax=Gigaspora rosea TaxID=44941 RepID=A0A397UY94_9GLOM|nr:hypothetical protein C2G38_2200481 [Gigaspora rosea]